jgi:ferric-dicitrate binding protein FerR (iron transport regulator)
VIRPETRCPGLTFEAERATQYRLIDRNQDGTPEGARVSGGAVLIDVDPSRRGGFQILTPHATAAVRGTTYAVDVQQIQTSVFVAQGRVAVQGWQTRERVVLGSGQGVDVVPGQALEVKNWSPQRASRLLGRFGR